MDLRRIPLLIPASGWVTGLAAARMDWVSWSVLACLAVIAGVLLLFVSATRPRKYVAFLLLGIVWGVAHLAWDARLAAFDARWLEGTQQISAVVVETRHTPSYTRLTLQQVSGARQNVRPLPGRAWLYVYRHAATHIVPGNRIRARVRWHVPHNHHNPGGFDFAAYCFDRHIALLGSARGKATLVAAHISWLEGVRQRIRDVLQRFPDKHRGVFEALLLADRSHIPIDIQNAFAATGSMHLLAISGLHIGMAGAIGFALCWWLLTRREAWIVHLPVRGWSMLAAMLAAIAYASLAGWPLPAQRATLMLAAGVVAWWLKARAEPLNTLFAALMLMLLADAQAVESISLWLSFIATAAILSGVGKHAANKQERRLQRALITALQVSIAASLATLPLIADVFGRLPIYGLLANIVMVPLYSLYVLPLALAAAGCAALGISGMAAWLFSIAAYGIDAGNYLLAWMLQWPLSRLWIPAVPWWLTGFYMAGVVVTGFWLWKGKRRLAWASMAVVVLIYGVMAAQERFPAQLQFTAWDVGQGAAASLTLPDGNVMVVDAPGRRGSRFNGGTIVAAGLRAEGMTHVDVMVITHAQSDHMGGMLRLTEQVNKVKELWLADVPGVKRHPYIRRLVRRVRMHGGRVRWLQRGDIIHLGQVKGKVLWPPAGFAPNNPNNASLVLSLQLPHGKRLLLPGDIEAEAETGMLADNMQAQAIMLMPHHGSTTSSTTAFIRATMPELAIVQSGYANRYGFPKPQVVQRYKHVGAQVRNTAHGAVIVTQGDKGDMHVTYAKPVRSDKRSDILQWWQRRL